MELTCLAELEIDVCMLYAREHVCALYHQHLYILFNGPLGRLLVHLHGSASFSRPVKPINGNLHIQLPPSKSHKNDQR